MSTTFKGVVAAMIMSSGFFSKPKYGSCAYTGIPIRREYSSNVPELIIWKGEAVIRWIVKLYQCGKDPIHNVGIEKRQKFSILLLESLGVDHQFSELSQFLDLGKS